MSDKQVDSYIKSLNQDEIKVIEIAKETLGTSFDISKSIGFKIWLNKI
jgi:hypothetical protein